MKRCALTRRTPLIRRTRLRPCSPKHVRDLREYYQKRLHFLILHPDCELCPVIRAAGFSVSCGGFSNQIHHTRRRGKYLLDEKTWRAGCPRGHHWLETHANEARRLGLIKT